MNGKICTCACLCLHPCKCLKIHQIWSWNDLKSWHFSFVKMHHSVVPVKKKIMRTNKLSWKQSISCTSCETHIWTPYWRCAQMYWHHYDIRYVFNYIHKKLTKVQIFETYLMKHDIQGFYIFGDQTESEPSLWGHGKVKAYRDHFRDHNHGHIMQ